ncbi:hypothetical protein ACFDR9_000586 [Janthinobacterium sp. CG_23.3]|uniref:hypothetical protein n=1 Tax=Janthinobacterium sp. CG_23.3 TaxID=3349634 RepID=UPI0038D44C14
MLTSPPLGCEFYDAAAIARNGRPPATYYESYKAEDTVRGTIDVKIRKAVRWVEDPAIRRKVEMEVRAERESSRRMKGAEVGGCKGEQGRLLAQLVSFEKMAKGLDRARSLRRFTDEIVASNAAPAELVGRLELMALMADWLHPLVKEPWPDVDGVGDRKPYGGLW